MEEKEKGYPPRRVSFLFFVLLFFVLFKIKFQWEKRGGGKSLIFFFHVGVVGFFSFVLIMQGQEISFYHSLFFRCR